MPAGVKTKPCSRSDREMMPLTTSPLSTRTSRWTWGVGGEGNTGLRVSHETARNTVRWTPPPTGEGGSEDVYLCLDNAVDDGVQGLVGVALDHALHVTRASADGLLHAHVQVVVRLLSCQVLPQEEREGERHTSVKLGTPMTGRCLTVDAAMMYSQSHQIWNRVPPLCLREKSNITFTA